MKRITLLCAFFALAQFAHADVFVLETDGLVAKHKTALVPRSHVAATPVNAHIAKPGEKHHGIPLSAVHPSATGSIALIDALGLKYFINTSITFSTTSSASAAMSEASYTHSVVASTVAGGTTMSTLNDSFDGYGTICVSLTGALGPCQTGNANYIFYNKTGAAPTNECSGRQIVFPAETIGALSVNRKVYVPTDDAFARWLNVVTNTSAAPVTFNVISANNLGSDANTIITGSSSSANPPTVADNWVTTFQNFSGSTSSDPRLGHVLQGPGAATPLSGIHFADGDDNPYWAYTVTLNPGETKILMNFVTALGTKAAAATQAAALTALPHTSLECLTPAEKLEISNFAIPTPTAIQAIKTYSGDTFVGGIGTYTVVLTNTGGTAQPDNTGDEFTDVLPANLTLVSATATSGTAVGSAGTVHWNGSLAPAGSVTITINVTIASGAVGSTVSNQGMAFFDADGDGTNESSILTDDPAVAGATPDPTTFVVTGGSIISGTKTVSGTFVVGNTVTYTIVLTNSGNGPQADNPGNEFTDVLPATLQLVSATATSGTAVGNVGTNTVTWNGALATSSSVTITITGTILSSAAGQNVSNQGAISYDSDGNGTNDASALTDDPAVAGSADPTVFAVTGGANMSGTKSVSGTFTIGNTVTYSIVLTNGGAGPQADNAGDEFTDVLPATLQLVSASATSGTAIGNAGTNTVTWNGALASSASVTITITATILPTAAGHDVSNQGTISYDSDGDGTNDSSALTSSPGSAGPTVFAVAALPAVPVPLSSALSLILLALAFASVAFFALRRRI